MSYPHSPLDKWKITPPAAYRRIREILCRNLWWVVARRRVTCRGREGLTRGNRGLTKGLFPQSAWLPATTFLARASLRALVFSFCCIKLRTHDFYCLLNSTAVSSLRGRWEHPIFSLLTCHAAHCAEVRWQLLVLF